MKRTEDREQLSMNRWADSAKLPFLKRYQNIILVLNLVLLGGIILFLLIHRSPNKQVLPLVEGNQKTTGRIEALEQLLERSPRNIKAAVELARLYQDVGEFPWSYNALKVAEKSDNFDPKWRFMLGLAYLELGKNKDAKRVIEKTQHQCSSIECPANLAFQLELFDRLVQRFIEKGINARKHYGAAEKVMQELLKPVTVDPEKMHPKKSPQTEPPKESGKPKG